MKALIVLGLVLFVSCSSTKNEKKAIEDQAAHSNVKSSKALTGTIHDLIDNSQNLSDAQKKELYRIIDINKKTAERLSEESYKYRSILVKELLSKQPSRKKINIIKDDIKRVESLRLKNTFDTVEKISSIVNDHPDHAHYAEHLIQIERSTR